MLQKLMDRFRKEFKCGEVEVDNFVHAGVDVTNEWNEDGTFYITMSQKRYAELNSLIFADNKVAHWMIPHGQKVKEPWDNSSGLLVKHVQTSHTAPVGMGVK